MYMYAHTHSRWKSSTVSYTYKFGYVCTAFPVSTEFSTLRQNVLITKCVPITLHVSHKRDARRNDSRFHAHKQEMRKAFGMVNIKELLCLEEPRVDGIILKWILKKFNRCGLNLSESG